MHAATGLFTREPESNLRIKCTKTMCTHLGVIEGVWQRPDTAVWACPDQGTLGNYPKAQSAAIIEAGPGTSTGAVGVSRGRFMEVQVSHYHRSVPVRPIKAKNSNLRLVQEAVSSTVSGSYIIRTKCARACI